VPPIPGGSVRLEGSLAVGNWRYHGLALDRPGRPPVIPQTGLMTVVGTPAGRSAFGEGRAGVHAEIEQGRRLGTLLEEGIGTGRDCAFTHGLVCIVGHENDLLRRRTTGTFTQDCEAVALREKQVDERQVPIVRMVAQPRDGLVLGGSNRGDLDTGQWTQDLREEFSLGRVVFYEEHFHLPAFSHPDRIDIPGSLAVAGPNTRTPFTCVGTHPVRSHL